MGLKEFQLQPISINWGNRESRQNSSNLRQERGKVNLRSELLAKAKLGFAFFGNPVLIPHLCSGQHLRNHLSPLLPILLLPVCNPGSFPETEQIILFKHTSKVWPTQHVKYVSLSPNKSTLVFLPRTLCSFQLIPYSS